MKPSLDTALLPDLEAAVRALGEGEVLPDSNTRAFAASLTGAWLAALESQGPGRALVHAAERSSAASTNGWGLHHEVWSVCVSLALAEKIAARGRAEGKASLVELGHELAVRSRALCASDGDAPSLHALDAVVRDARQRVLARRNALPDGPGRAMEHLCLDQLSHVLSQLQGRHVSAEAVVTEALRNADRQLKRAVQARPEVRRQAARRALLGVAAELAWACADSLDVDHARNRAAVWMARAATRMASQLPHAERWIAEESEASANTQSPPEAPERSPDMTQSKQNLQAVRTQTPNAESTMNNTMQPLLKTLQTDATEAAWRTAGSQFVKLAREPLVGLLSRHLGPNDEALRGRIAAFLETELGTAMLSAMLSAALGALPATAGEVPQRLSRELRVRAMADTADVLADVLMGPLRQVVQLYLQDPLGAPAQPAALPGAELRLSDLAAEQAQEREPVRT